MADRPHIVRVLVYMAAVTVVLAVLGFWGGPPLAPAYSRLQVGMSPAEVKRIAGPPDEASGGPALAVYFYDNDNPAAVVTGRGERIEVVFVDGHADEIHYTQGSDQRSKTRGGKPPR